MRTLTIAHIDSELSWRGGQKQVIELIRGLSQRGQRNLLICRRGSKIAEKAETEGIDVTYIPLRGEWDVISAWKLRKIIKKRGIDIIHTHNSHAHTIALFALAGIPKCKLVVSRRVDFHIQNPLSRVFKYSSRVDKIIAVSDAIKRILVEDGIDPGLITTIRSGFVFDQFINSDKSHDIRHEMGIPADTIVITTVASLAPHKAHMDLLKSASLVVKKHPNVRFLLAGEGTLREQIEKQINNLELEPYVMLLGFIDDIGSLYRASDIFALTSEEEGLCTSILDAMYFHLPIVATSAGGIPEIVHDQSNGFIVPVHDYMAFADRLNLLIEQPERRKTMGERSGDILPQYSITHTVEQTLALYRTLTGLIQSSDST
ncbi:glycosyltransferase [Candidatus Latescibacterota bacterium]